MTKVEEFVRCLSIMSYSRAGWDYEMSREQRANEAGAEREALATARSIWAGNPDLRDELRAAFFKAGPLATLHEIESA